MKVTDIAKRVGKYVADNTKKIFNGYTYTGTYGPSKLVANNALKASGELEGKVTSFAGKELSQAGFSRKEIAEQLRDLRKKHSISGQGKGSIEENIIASREAMNREITSSNVEGISKESERLRTKFREKAAAAKGRNKPDSDWLDDGYSAEDELGGMRRGYDQNAAPKASSRNMGATDEDLAAGGDKAAKGRVMRKKRQARREAAREEANSGGSEKGNRAWYDDDESRAFAQSQADENLQQLRVDWSNKRADLNEKIAKAKKAGDAKAIEKLQNEKREAYLGYRKERESFFERGDGGRVYDVRKDGTTDRITKSVDPGVLDWVRGHGYDKAGAGIGALGFAGVVAFGGRKSNADLYSNPF